MGAYVSDILLQAFGLGAFLLTVFPGMLGIRWFRSRKVQAPLAKSLGAIWLLMFVPALLAILPGHVRWMNAIPIEGLLGRIVGDALIHYFNLAGAYIVCATVLAVALYLTTAFSFSSVQVWVPTRLAFLFALRDRWTDWKEERQKQKLQRELEKRRSQKPVVTTQAVSRGERFEDEQRATRPVEARVAAAEGGRPTGIERVMDAGAASQTISAKPSAAEQSRAEAEPLPGIAVAERADTGQKTKTVLPKIAGNYKLPPSSLLHRPDEQQVVDAEELKLLAQVLVAKYAEFDVHGQVTQINPGRRGNMFEFKPEAGVKYSRIINLTDRPVPCPQGREAFWLTHAR